MVEHISRYAGDVERFGDGEAATAQQLVPDDAAVTKAAYVLRMLKDAGLRQPFDWNEKDATLLWAAALGPIHIDDVEAAVGQWITQPGREWPSVGDMLSMCRGVELDREEAHRAHNRRACGTCHDVHYVRAPDASPAGYHMAPCPTCPAMSNRRALYDSGHFTAAHMEAGGCPDCWPYTDPPRHKARVRAATAGR